ncbi:MAG TPA: ABC transporter ATP-binding protein, partial [Bacillota bacterium]|nr:ABC transporter ATP-binding protein [Bacillota bacterium]
RRARIADALDRVGLAPAARQPVRTYSKGMQQRLGLGCAMLGEPPLLFLDEPTSALDPVGRREVREILLQLRGEGRTVFLNSHLLSEIELVSDHVAVIREGRVAAAGSLADLVGAAHEAELRVDAAGAAAVVAAGWQVLARQDGADGTLAALRVALPQPEAVADLAQAVIAGGGRLHGLQARTRSLEDAFIELVRD